MEFLRREGAIKVAGIILLVSLLPRFIKPREISYYFQRLMQSFRTHRTSRSSPRRASLL